MSTIQQLFVDDSNHFRFVFFTNPSFKENVEYMNADALSNLKNMNLMNSSRNFNEYRDVLKFIDRSHVPFLVCTYLI